MESQLKMADTMTICTYPDPVLRVKAEPVTNIDGEILGLVDRMAATMYAAPGIGLAANQVGENKRIIVFDLLRVNSGKNLSVLINPEIVLAEGSITHEEACLSVPDFSSDVTRKAKVKIRGVDRDGKPVDIEAEDNLLAICLQHEIDHLNGILFIDHISSLKRALYKKKLKKTLAKAKES
jgi:peptide deformylase